MTNKSTLLSNSLSADETSLKYMLKLAAPMVVTTVSFTIMQFVDRFMVSRLGTEELAAVMPAGFVAFLPESFAAGVFASVATFVSQSLGSGRKNQCAHYCWQAIYIGLAYDLIVLTVMWSAAPWIFKTMGHEPTVAQMEVVYLRILLYAEVMSVFVWAIDNFFIGIHRPIIIMYAALCSQIVNVTVNYVLIFGKLGFPALGIAGAGWGTFTGILIGAVIRTTVYLGDNVNIAFNSRKATSIDLSKMKDLIKIGLPAGLEMTLNVALWGVILFWLVGKFGKEAMAATSAVLSCAYVSIMPVVGIKTALTVAVGKAIGKGRKDIAIKQTKTCLKIAVVYMGFVGLCFLLFRDALMALWSSDDKVIEIGMKILVCAAVYQVFHATRTVYSGALRGAGDTLWLAAASMLGAALILGLGGLLFVELLPGLGALGPWIAATGSIIFVGLANRWRFKSNRWMQIDLFKYKTIGVPIESETTVE